MSLEMRLASLTPQSHPSLTSQLVNEKNSCVFLNLYSKRCSTFFRLTVSTDVEHGSPADEAVGIVVLAHLVGRVVLASHLI